MVGPERPQIVLFGSSIVQQSFSNRGWGTILADLYSRKVPKFFFFSMKSPQFFFFNFFSSSPYRIPYLTFNA